MAENKIKTIGVLTSGGDAPGMNADNPVLLSEED